MYLVHLLNDWWNETFVFEQLIISKNCSTLVYFFELLTYIHKRTPPKKLYTRRPVVVKRKKVWLNGEVEVPTYCISCVNWGPSLGLCHHNPNESRLVEAKLDANQIRAKGRPKAWCPVQQRCGVAVLPESNSRVRNSKGKIHVSTPGPWLETSAVAVPSFRGHLLPPTPANQPRNPPSIQFVEETAPCSVALPPRKSGRIIANIKRGKKVPLKTS